MLRKANTQDANSIRELINTTDKESQLLPRSLNDIYENLRDFSVFELEGSICGCCALHITWGELGEIRSLVVNSAQRGKYIGTNLVEHALEEARQLKLKKVFALTTKPNFFQKLGFEEIDKAELPHKIWTDCVQCVQFPECNEIAMIKEID